MVVIISNKVLDSIYDYAKSLTNYPICSSRARQKVDQLISALNALGSSISTPSVCMNKDLLQTFDRKGNPINKNLKRFNYKDESNFQWAFACLYDYENDTIIVLKMMSAIFIKETLADRINIIVEKNLNKFALRKALLENNNTKTQNKMKQRIRLTEGDLHRIIRKCVNKTLNEDFMSNDDFEPHKTIYKCLKEFQNYFHLQYEGYINKIISELKYVVEENKNELSEEGNLDSLQKFIDNIETICQDIKFAQTDILDLTHGRSIEYYNRYGY